MHCILIGVTGPFSRDNAAWSTVTQFITTMDENERQHSVSWISYSTTHDEDGRHVTLLCATTEASVDDVIYANAQVISRELGDRYSCELWASAPAILPLRPVEGYEQFITLALVSDHSSSAPAAAATTIAIPTNTLHHKEEWAVSTMKEWGMLIQTALVTARELIELKHCIDEEITNIEKLIHHHRPDIIIGKDAISFQEIASRGNERFDLLLSPTSNARDFVEHVLLHRISPILERILDGRINETIDFDISVVYSKPNATNQGWHADGDHQKGTKDAGWDAANGWKSRLAEPYAICLFIPLIDLDDDTGYTQFWPASHRYRGLAGFGPVAEIAEATYDGKCSAGDAIWYDYRLMHRGMRNVSQVVRPVLQVLCKKTWYVEKRNYGIDSLRR
jgi:ectoine hydroxylase-related dioxygenase (phytanoyl-CoA dioxygenase family)